jgi:hypothetical protein
MVGQRGALGRGMRLPVIVPVMMPLGLDWHVRPG